VYTKRQVIKRKEEEMKTITIKIMIKDNKLGHIIEKVGFNKTIEDQLLVIGTLERLKKLQMDNIKIQFKKNIKE
jgi:hypothetical protein